MESVKWYQSDAMKASIGGLFAALVAGVVAILSLFGITLDPAFQGKLIAACMALYALVAMGFHVWSLFARLNTTTVIEGSKGEKAVLAANIEVTPKPKT